MANLLLIVVFAPGYYSLYKISQNTLEPTRQNRIAQGRCSRAVVSR